MVKVCINVKLWRHNYFLISASSSPSSGGSYGDGNQVNMTYILKCLDRGTCIALQYPHVCDGHTIIYHRAVGVVCRNTPRSKKPQGYLKTSLELPESESSHLICSEIGHNHSQNPHAAILKYLQNIYNLLGITPGGFRPRSFLHTTPYIPLSWSTQVLWTYLLSGVRFDSKLIFHFESCTCVYAVYRLAPPSNGVSLSLRLETNVFSPVLCVCFSSSVFVCFRTHLRCYGAVNHLQTCVRFLSVCHIDILLLQYGPLLRRN